MRLQPWLFLFVAIAAEVTGVTVMKFVSGSGSVTAFIFMYATIGLSFYFLAMAVKDLPIALAYATWETIGLITIAFIGFCFFTESMGIYKLSGMAVLIAGVVMVNFGATKRW
ncbi:spermidine export protein MdtJ [Serratia marcescens]|uniref:Spermidine export protein MdtJ n=1 Tax=Serratia marcescens TaxID=615 RepID=A0AA46K8M5_SERMA|nr:multidrug efflux SMR transporter [Serratia marcescens]TQI86490.1 spermidine export protein MdtJ [Serratia marcescens]HEJ7121861.1 multidrug efflux SMR transporter [Serratia marcescens]